MGLIKLVLLAVIELANLLILVRCVLSWLPISYNALVEWIYRLTDPMLMPIQKILNSFMGGRSLGIDLSPIIVFFLLSILTRVIMIL